VEFPDVAPMTDGILSFPVPESVYLLIDAKTGVEGAQGIGTNRDHVCQSGACTPRASVVDCYFFCIFRIASPKACPLR
jgi:hypothetical protein